MTTAARPATRRRGRRLVGIGLLAAAVGWILVNQPVEGPVLVSVTPEHGLTVADLPSLAAGIVGLLLLWSSR